MTVQSATRIAGPYTGTGSAATLPFAFKVFSANDLLVTRGDVPLALGGDFTATLNTDQENNPGGTVSITAAAYTTGSVVYIESQVSETQGADIPNRGGFFPEVIEAALDKLTILVQQLRSTVSRAVLLPRDATSWAGKFISFDADGKPVPVSSAPSDGGLRGDLAAPSGSALVGFQQIGSGAVARSAQAKMRGYITPEDFGAVGDGTTDDRAALELALQSGLAVDGQGRTYAVSGQVTPSSIVALRNIGLKQIADKTGSHYRLLNLVGLSDFTIENVRLDVGPGITSLYNDDAAGGLFIGTTNPTIYCERFVVRNVRVTGNGCGTGIHLRNCKRFTLADCLVHDRISGSSPDPTNDSQNGYEFNNCANFTVASSHVYNLQSRLAGVPVQKWTRGFLFVEIRDGTIVGCTSTNVDQCFDFSGAYVAEDNFIGSRRFTVSACVANGGLLGFKFANVNREALVTGCIANNCGRHGFFFSPSAAALPGGLEKYNTQNIDVVGCRVINVTGTGWADVGTATGFSVISNGLYPSYPRGIRFKDCDVTDSQDVPTTLRAFSSNVTPVEYNAADYDKDIASYMIGCTSRNVATHAVGIGPMIAQVTGSATQSVPNAAWTSLGWNAESIDLSGLHSTTNIPENVFIKAAGYYRITAHLVFPANGTGIRQARLLLNGAPIDRTVVAGPGNASCDTVLRTSIVQYCDPGQNVRVEVNQNSGGSMAFKSNESHFLVERI